MSRAPPFRFANPIIKFKSLTSITYQNWQLRQNRLKEGPARERKFEVYQVRLNIPSNFIVATMRLQKLSTIWTVRNDP